MMKCADCQKTDGSEFVRIGGMEYWVCFRCSLKTKHSADYVVQQLKALFANQERVNKIWGRF